LDGVLLGIKVGVVDEDALRVDDGDDGTTLSPALGMVDGDEDGLILGVDDVSLDGDALGVVDGVLLGIRVGVTDGDMLGVDDGSALGLRLSTTDGAEDGCLLGADDGSCDSNVLGDKPCFSSILISPRSTDGIGEIVDTKEVGAKVVGVNRFRAKEEQKLHFMAQFLANQYF